MNCIFCGEEIQMGGKVEVGRQDTCARCNRDLRCCKQCKFYDPSAYNDCKEVSAERILEKERANFCDFFLLRGSKVAGGSLNRRKEAKMALEALFKKK